MPKLRNISGGRKGENMRIKVLILLSICIVGKSGFSHEKTKSSSDFPILKGQYLGQTPPGMTPEIFAPGIVSTGLPNRDVAISPDGKEMYFGIHTENFQYSTILITKQIDDHWTRPEVVSFAIDPRYVYLEPFISCDGNKLFFLSNMPKDDTGNPGDEDIWVVEKNEGGWGKPTNLGDPVNSDGQEYFPALTEDGTLYFTRAKKGERIHYIYRSRFVDGKYTTPEKLPEQINCGRNRFNAYVAPDESYVVVPAVGVEEGVGGVNYYIVFKDEEDSWQEPVNMGPIINSPKGNGWSFYVSPDKKFVFFMSTRKLPEEKQPQSLNYEFFKNLSSIPENGNSDIYWIDAKIIETLKPR